MPFVTHIRCPSNGQVLASFCDWGSYRYQLDNGIEFPLDVAYAWCHRCESFVECERLYTVDEIEDRIAGLELTRDQWSKIDAEKEERYAEIDRKLPNDLTQRALYRTWCAALVWRQERRAPPRCLECGSFFAIEVLPDSEIARHPGGECMVEVCCGGHASVDGFPDVIYYNAEGLRVAHSS